MLPTLYQQFIHSSRYARWLENESRRETWPETVKRYVDFMFDEQVGGALDADREEVTKAILDLRVMPSMRAMMTAGPALARDNLAGFSCAYMPVAKPSAFDETMYILTCGTGVGFSVEQKEVEKLPTIAEEFHNDDTTIVVADSKIGWSKAFKQLISLLYGGTVPKVNYSKVRAVGERLKTMGGRACLTSDTIVYKDRKKTRGFNEITLKTLWEMKTSGKWLGTAGSQPGPAHFSKIKLRSLDESEGIFFRNQLLDIVDNGEEPVYTLVTENGYRIKATDNHRFMNALGKYQSLSDFSVGEDIAVNGSEKRESGTCVSCGRKVDNKSVKCPSCYNNSTPDGLEKENRRVGRDAYRKLVGDSCESCGVRKLRLIVHHKDEDLSNNRCANLVTLCEGCHRKHHASVNTFGDPYSHKYLSYDKIISIEYAGVERVYDLVMEGPNHNFVANGFVSHNSGPEPLRDLFLFTEAMFKNAAGRKLSPIECHDLMCKVGEVVVVGGVRRSALISLSDLSDMGLRDAKTGKWWEINGQRALANNSAVYELKPTPGTFMKEWLSLYRSKSGERGIFNRNAAIRKVAENGRRNTEWAFGTNPCSEIILRPYQFCNLSEVVVRADDTPDTLKVKIRIAVIMGVMQSTMTNFRYLSSIWKRNTEEECLLGVSLTGVLDNKFFSDHTNPQLAETLKDLRAYAVKVSKEYADKLGINASVAVTCGKPSGTVSQLVDCASGIVHPRHSKYYIRTVRGDKKDPLSQMLKDTGIPCEDDITKRDSTYVFSFPIKSPIGAVTRNDLMALDQLDLWLLYSKHWCEHKVSATINVGENEWFDVAAWVWRNFDDISGVSFLPREDHIYQQAPYQEITEEEYKAAMEKMPKDIDFTKLSEYEKEDTTTSSREFACVSGACDIVDIGK